MFRGMHFITHEKKIDILILKVMIKNMNCWFCTATQYSFILDSIEGVDYRRVWRVMKAVYK